MNIRVAVLGTGHWGKNLVRNFSELGVLRSVFDVDQGHAKKVSEPYKGLYLARSSDEVINDKDIDAVVIASPAVTHYRLAKDALLAGKHVFVEKPMALVVKEGEELVELAEKKRRVLMVGHILEYHPGILKLKRLIDSGELGRIYYIYSNRLNLGKIRREENILWCFAPHDISVMLLLLNEMPLRISAHGGNYLRNHIADVTVSTFEFASGVKGHVFVSWLHPYKEQRLIVVGDKKMAVFDDVTRKGSLLLYSHKIEISNQIPIAVNAPAEEVPFSLSEPLKEECMHFLKSIEKKKRPKTDGHSGVKVLQVLQACQRSLERGGEEIILNTESFKSHKCYIHPSATIENPCTIGEGTKIWHYTHVMKDAHIGNNCQIGQNVFVGPGAFIGNGVKVQNNVSVYEGVTLEDGVFCGPSVVFTNVINPRSHISRKKEFKETIVRKGATVGANATVICGTTIGKYAFVGAGAVVTKDIPDYALAYGNPAVVAGWICSCGIKLTVKGCEGRCPSCGEKITIKNDENKRAKKR